MKRTLLMLCMLLYTCFAQGFFGQHSAVKAYHAGEYGAALEQFESLLTRQPDDPQLNYNAGKAAYKAQEYAAAAAYFSQAVKQREIPEALAVQSWFDLGNTQVKQKKWQEALSSYENVLTLAPEHKEAQEMIEKIKKLLEEQRKQEEQNQQENEQQNEQNDQSQDKDQQQNKEQQKQQDKQKQKSQDQKKNQNNEPQKGENDEQENEQHGQQDQSKTDNNQQSSQQKSDDTSQGSQDNKSQSGEQEQGEGEESDQNEQDGKSSQDSSKKQNLDSKDTKKGGEQVGDKGQSDKSEKDLQQDRGDDLENTVPEIQDHQRKDNSMDHSASPTQTHSHSKKQDTPVSAKAQASEADPFAIDDGIDKNSREGKLLQFIESRDAQAAQQLLKMNVQTQRKPGEKNW